MNGIATLSPPPNQQIQVQPADVLGLHVYSKPLSHGTPGFVVHVHKLLTLEYPPGRHIRATGTYSYYYSITR